MDKQTGKQARHAQAKKSCKRKAKTKARVLHPQRSRHYHYDCPGDVATHSQSLHAPTDKRSRLMVDPRKDTRLENTRKKAKKTKDKAKRSRHLVY